MSVVTNPGESERATASKAVVLCRGISKSFSSPTGNIAALKEVSLELEAGEFVAIRGKSGCGKSTLMLCMGGLQKPDAGTVSINGQSLYEMNADKRAKFRGENIGYVFQQFHLIPYLTLLENVMAARVGVGDKHTAEELARELVDRVDLSHRISHKPEALSVGECQRVAIARALMNRPQVILADEPTGNLDQENTSRVLDSLKQIADEGTTVALVTHDEQIDQIADRVVRIANGQIA